MKNKKYILQTVNDRELTIIAVHNSYEELLELAFIIFKENAINEDWGLEDKHLSTLDDILSSAKTNAHNEKDGNLIESQLDDEAGLSFSYGEFANLWSNAKGEYDLFLDVLPEEDKLAKLVK